MRGSGWDGSAWFITAPRVVPRASAISRVVLMPQTGWDALSFAWTMIQFVLGALIAFGLYGAGLWAVLRRVQ